MELVLILLLLAGAVALVVRSSNKAKARELERKQTELEPVRKLVDEDVTALGTELQDLDLDMTGHDLDPGANADYQRALDAYEAAKSAAERITEPDQVKHVTEILEDGRYAMACVRARVEGRALPTRRQPCFFDPRHGPSDRDVLWAPSGGAPRDVPACALDAERVEAGAEPDSRKVLVGTERRPYYEAGGAFQPYAAGYFGMNAMNMMFVGMMFGGAFGGFDGGGDYGDGGGDGGGDFGGGDGGGGDGGGFDFGDFGF
ncbi:hypothetical protein [Nocardioides sp. AX2bis]|uniref:hypothetical protein n=1 Tax=Nocardioides sp. AX2bis TaxID=2653157 RepID=UPI0012EFA950|nr:hypothetical protein [Nocardioides sp. AX2bis]VXB21717.1 conserved exported hypothetical protein [Nocardioides sp. AX2bis]